RHSASEVAKCSSSHSSLRSSSESRTRSANENAARTRSAAVGTATTVMRPALAASTPAEESSKTKQRSGATARAAAAVKKTPGCGLPKGSNSAECSETKRSVSPKWVRHLSIKNNGVELARATGPRAEVSSMARTAPGSRRPLASTRSPTHARSMATTSEVVGPDQGWRAYQYS